MDTSATRVVARPLHVLPGARLWLTPSLAGHTLAAAMFTIHPAAPTESGTVSELILQSDCGLLAALFGTTVKSLLSYLQARPGNPYSSTNMLVVSDDDGSRFVIGALVGALAAVTRRSNLRTAALLLAWYGPAVAARFPRLARAGKALDDLRRDDFYLSHIAVLPEHRGRGAGRELLRSGEERARQQGANRLVLDVEEHNDRARSFYARLDYRPASLLRIDLGRRGAFSFVRLFKDL
ncbi:MAG: GNAT family N-acetyltransferase [Spirochaetia bacterium]